MLPLFVSKVLRMFIFSMIVYENLLGWEVDWVREGEEMESEGRKDWDWGDLGGGVKITWELVPGVDTEGGDLGGGVRMIWELVDREW